MSEPTRDELMLRIERLERANRRWRWGSLLAASVVGLAFIFLAGALANSYLEISRAEQRATRALDAYQALERAERAREQLEEKTNALKHRSKTANDIPLNLNDVLWPLPFPEEHWEPPHDRISPLDRP
jgi:hypothetical protein